MSSLLVLLLLVFAAPVFLTRALILFPVLGLRSGWRRATTRCRISLVLTVTLLVYEAGNLTGFSWERGSYVGADELRAAAIRAAYGPVYGDLAALRADYPGFTPEIRYQDGWNAEFQSSVFDKLVGFTRYQVRLPESTAILDTSGRFVTLRGCDTDPCPPPILPARPVFGVIATVQLGREPYDRVEDYDAHWSDGTRDGIIRSGHCLSALREGTPAQELIITRPGTYPASIRPQFGYFLDGLQLMPETVPPSIVRGSATAVRLTKADFLNWRSCDPALRDAWPNLGFWWKR